MIKTALGAQRYNNHMNKVWDRAIQAKKEVEQYQEFVKTWESNHKISKAPSFESWKEFYQISQ